MAVKKVGTPAKKLEGVEYKGITWFPDQIKKYKTEDEFVKAHSGLKSLKPRGKVNASKKAKSEKDAEDFLKEVYAKFKK